METEREDLKTDFQKSVCRMKREDIWYKRTTDRVNEHLRPFSLYGGIGKYPPVGLSE